MKAHMLFRIKQDGKWTTLEGAIHDSWATYDSVSDCLSWQNRLSDRNLLDHDVAQVICVADDKMAAFREAQSKGESVQQLVASSPDEGFDPMTGLLLFGVGGLLVAGYMLLKLLAGRRWI